MNIIFSVWTVLVCVIFVGITWWAWSSKQEAEMTAAANMIFDEADETDEQRSSIDG